MTTQPEPQTDAPVELPASNVIEALRRVMRDLPGIGKDSKAAKEQGGYAYRGIEAITREAQSLLAKHGVVFTPSVTECTITDIVVNSKPWTDTRLTVIYNVYGPGGPGDRIQVGPLVAIGRDNSDKGANKAMTQAFKYALLQTLCISDAKDDADSGSPEADEYSQTARAGAPMGPDEVSTSAGNVRRGPRVLDGWDSIEAQRTAHDNLLKRSRRLNDEQRAEMTAWRAERGYGWPMTHDELVDSVARLLEVEDAAEAVDAQEAASAPTEAAETAPVAAEPPAGGDDAQEAPETAPEWQAGDTAATERHARFEGHVADLPLPQVREQLEAAGLESKGAGPMIRRRLIDHFVAQSTAARVAAETAAATEE